MEFEDIRAAAQRIAPYVERTPLIRMRNLDGHLGCEVYAKLECMQVTNSFKLRGAMNAVLRLPQEKLEGGVVAASSGNHGRAIAHAARMLGVAATIVMPDTATPAKVNNIRKLGAQVVTSDSRERFEVARRISGEQGAAIVPPFDDEDVMAGQGTVGIEVCEQQPDLDALVAPVSGGGLLSGVATAIAHLAPGMRVIGAEPAELPRYSASLAAGRPVQVPKPEVASIADALVALEPGTRCFPYVREHVERVVAVDESRIVEGWELMAREGKILAEPSSCVPAGALLQGLIDVKPTDKVCILVSGGNAAIEQLQALFR